MSFFLSSFPFSYSLFLLHSFFRLLQFFFCYFLLITVFFFCLFYFLNFYSVFLSLYYFLSRIFLRLSVSYFLYSLHPIFRTLVRYVFLSYSPSIFFFSYFLYHIITPSQAIFSIPVSYNSFFFLRTFSISLLLHPSLSFFFSLPFFLFLRFITLFISQNREF